MSISKTPTLSSILEQFSTQRKTAGLEEEQGDSEEELNQQTSPDIEGAAQNVAEASQVFDEAAASKEDAASELVDAAEVLRELALESVSEHTDALAKEACIFGELFASSVMDTMQKTAAGQAAEEEAYAMTMNGVTQAKLASTYEGAYQLCLLKLGEDEAYALASRQMGAELPAWEGSASHFAPPEKVLPTEEFTHEEDEDEDEDEDWDAEYDEQDDGHPGLRESVADSVQHAAHAAQAAAEAANILAEHTFGGGSIPELPKLASQAYGATSRWMGQ